jgi:hypothetical protein
MAKMITQINLAKYTLASFALASLAYASSCLHGNVAHAQQPSETPAQLFQEKCSACHNLPDPQTNAMTATGWQRTVDRMLVQHGASSSISPDQAKTIVTYLDTFAIQPSAGNGRNGGQSDNAADVWATAPAYSHVYMYSTDPTASQVKTLSGHCAFRAADMSSNKQLILAAFGGKSGLFSESLPPQPKDAASPRDLQLEADFAAAPPAPGSKIAPPVSFGVAFDVVDAGDYVVAAYDDDSHAISVTRYTDNALAAVQTLPVVITPQPSPDGWHHLKVIVVGGKIKIWLDYTKYTSNVTSDPNHTGDVGMWSGSRAVVKNLTVDIYTPAQASTVQ